MQDDDTRHESAPRGSRPSGEGERARRRAGGGLFDSGLFDLAPIDRVLRDITSWFDDELPGRRASGRRSHRSARSREYADEAGDTASGSVFEQRERSTTGTGSQGSRDEPGDRDDYADENAARPGSLRGRGPKNYRRSSERVKELVSDVLYDDELLDASDIEVSVANGEVTLSGFVVSRRDKHRAENLAARIAYARDVDNRLRVRRSAAETTSDDTPDSTPGGTPGGPPGDAERDANDYGHSA